MTARRVVGAVAFVVVLAMLYSAWRAWRVERDLSRAQSSGQEVIKAVRDGDQPAGERALKEFRLSSSSAHHHTEGFWWGGLTHLPVLGDDAKGVQVMSASLDTVATDGVEPMVDSVDELTDISSGGRINLASLQALQQPVAESHAAFATARRNVSDLNSSGYAGPLKTRFRTYVDDIDKLDVAMDAAASALRVLPGFLGADGPRNYLLVIQNNAEIRATGGMPGAWVEVHTEDGKVSIVRQGTPADFAVPGTPVSPLSSGELATYSDLLGRYFADTTFTPDFPRAAALMRAHWDQTYPDQLDGVVSLDPVALSYLLAGTGPVKVGAVTLTSSNAVSELLSRPYLEQGTSAQNKFFAASTRAIFSAATEHLVSPIYFMQGLSRAADERRFYVASFTSTEADGLKGRVAGSLGDDDGEHPDVFVGLNDATASKMSYYLRYHAEVQATSCAGSRQSLVGTMDLDQTITAAQAQQLPVSVTGTGDHGTPLGSQLVAVRIYGPTGGTISNIKVDGAAVDVKPDQLANRPVVTLVAQLSGPQGVLVSWSMLTGPGQTGEGSVQMTPSVVPGADGSAFRSVC